MTITATTSTRVYIANLGKYNEGELVGQWLSLPATQEDIEAMYVNIGVGHIENGKYIHGLELNGVVYEETAIHDYETDIDGLEIGEYDNLNDLNNLMELFESLDEQDIEKIQAVMNCFGYEAEDVIDRLDDFVLYPFIHNEDDLGRYWLEKSGCYVLSSLGNLVNYIDYKSFGRDIALESNGGFTDFGFIEELR